MWFSHDGPTPVEERRLRTLDTLAQALSQLRKFTFDKIGSLEVDCSGNNNNTDKINIGPCYDWNEGVLGQDNYGMDPEIEACGPLESSKSYLQYYLDLSRGDDEKRENNPLASGCLILFEMMISCLPSSTVKRSSSPSSSSSVNVNQETFVFSLPDCGHQNILIDEQGNLTGIIDWEAVHTVPRFLGYCSFPSWITRDWDPVMYGYPKIKDTENTPEELNRYRQRYSAKMQEMLHGIGDARFANKTHVFEAVRIAAESGICRSEVVILIMERVLGVGRDAALDFIWNAGEGKLEPEDKVGLERQFREFFLVSE